MAAAKVYHAVGKRKSAIARIYLSNGSGSVTINDKNYEQYFEQLFQQRMLLPFKILDEDYKKYDLNINVAGGGTSSQAEACMYGIAKVFNLIDAKNRGPLKKAMLLTRDSRIVERKKYGHKKARKSFQFSKR